MAKRLPDRGLGIKTGTGWEGPDCRRLSDQAACSRPEFAPSRTLQNSRRRATQAAVPTRRTAALNQTCQWENIPPVITKGIGRPRSEAIRQAAIAIAPKPSRTRIKAKERSATRSERGSGFAAGFDPRTSVSGSKAQARPSAAPGEAVSCGYDGRYMIRTIIEALELYRSRLPGQKKANRILILTGLMQKRSDGFSSVAATGEFLPAGKCKFRPY